MPGSVLVISTHFYYLRTRYNLRQLNLYFGCNVIERNDSNPFELWLSAGPSLVKIKASYQLLDTFIAVPPNPMRNFERQKLVMAVRAHGWYKMTENASLRYSLTWKNLSSIDLISYDGATDTRIKMRDGVVLGLGLTYSF